MLTKKVRKELLIYGKQIVDFWVILGFADKSENAAYNLKLSQKRIASVKNELIHLGIKKDAITMRNFGSSKALKSESGNDRKVVIKLLKLK